MAGGLFDPLGTDRAERLAPRLSAPVIAAALAMAALAVLFAAAWLRDDGDRGRPVAVAPIERVEAPPRPVPPPPSAGPAPASAPVQATTPPPPASAAAPGLPPVEADQDVEVQNGVRIVRPRRSAFPGPPAGTGQTIAVPPAR